MTFDAPWMLAGLLGVAVVLWLHLRRPSDQVIRFPAVGILAEVSRRRAPRLRLRRIVLLALRCLAVAALALSMARPGIAVRRPGGLRSGMALAQVIVIDDSLSMRQKGADGVTAFERAKGLALAELRRLRPGDASAVALSGYPARAAFREPSFDLDKVAEAIRRLEPGFRSGDIETALHLASRQLEESPLAEREVVLVTDLAESGWLDRELAWSKDAGFGFRVIAAVDGPPPENAAVDGVRVEPTGEGAVREVVVEAQVTNHGERDLEAVEILLEINGVEEARASLDVPARGQAVKRFNHRFKEDGVRRGLVRIGGDALVEDGVRHFTFNVRPVLRALVVDGDYRPGSFRDEVFYLMRALAAPMPHEMPITAIAADLETAAAGPIAGYDVVVLAGVDELPPAFAARIVEFVRGGGGLLAAPGAGRDQLSGIEAILPGEVRSVSSVRSGDKAHRLGAVNRVHPIFSAFAEGPTGLEETRVFSHVLVEPDPALDRTVIAELAGGAPLLLERRSGRGTALLLTTTLDRDWTDLPIRPGFLPLVQRSVRYLANRLGERNARRVPVGGSIDLEVSGGMRRLLVVDPGGEETTFSAGDLADKSRVGFGGTEVPGSYRVFAELPSQGGLAELPALAFAVETDPKESELSRKVSAERVDAAAGGTKGAAASVAVVGRLPIWPYLLVAAVLLLILETLIAGLGFRRSHARS
ncbi:MAG: BatA and WFA domain-containing protein [Proteobacteria bacterium]|jgi:hypothetical protein|nr:BatA and WFA domain-containing protein [Pseudomonadota bacterium]